MGESLSWSEAAAAGGLRKERRTWLLDFILGLSNDNMFFKIEINLRSLIVETNV